VLGGPSGFGFIARIGGIAQTRTITQAKGKGPGDAMVNRSVTAAPALPGRLP
jgi:hypothetical protein